ncbi:S16 family serine protease [Paenisporosarcina sp. OV554]|uniref:S16 family serine protease n=1 Tax=Paenisporosarcina sp. OV554 TaxID=2135694 RepID=UPI000D369292|nr:S16 family serine protease [Paenisporosarcina sp. OV554]PUB13939.1 Lon protease-like protein [Paenisporosarcina sp. OV554]
MKYEFKNRHPNLPVVTMTLVYFIELFLYLINFISGFFFVNVLFLMSILILFFSLVIMKTAISKPPFVFSVIFSVFLFIYEMPLILIDNHQYLISSPNAPEELIKGSGIFLLSINVATIGSVENEQVLRDSYQKGHTKYFEIISVKNHARYFSKNKAIIESVGLYKDEFEQMSENVAGYLNTSNKAIDEFLTRDGSSGSSAGLGLVLSSLSEQGEFENDMLIGVTGAISKTGKVKEVGSINEKIQTANENGFSHIILPLANLSEAKEVKKKLNLPIEIIGVHDVDETIQLIKELNKR